MCVASEDQNITIRSAHSIFAEYCISIEISTQFLWYIQNACKANTIQHRYVGFQLIHKLCTYI